MELISALLIEEPPKILVNVALEERIFIDVGVALLVVVYVHVIVGS